MSSGLALRGAQSAYKFWSKGQKSLLSRTASTAASQASSEAGETKVSVLDNGIRVATEDTGAPTATIGIYTDTGSRYETAANNGVAHFLEHMLFKGTGKRTQGALELEIENMGAQVNAYTSREQTVFSAKCLSTDVGKSLDILSDILQNSKISEDAVERERGVILREMEEVEKDKREVVFDHLHATAYQGTPLGRTILGPTKNIKSITREDILDYVSTHYKGPRMVVAGAGGVNHEELCKLAEQHLGKIGNTYTGEIPLDLPCRYTGSDVRVRDDSMPLAYVALAVEAPGWSDPDNIALQVASIMIGSWDRSMGGGQHNASRLASYCAKENFCNSFQAFQTTYKDTGLFGVYFECEHMNQRHMTYNIQTEWMRMCNNITDFEVERAKNQLKANNLMALDGTTQTCEQIGTQMLTYGRRIPTAELMKRIDAVDATLVKEVCSKYIYDRCPVVAAVGPTENLPDYNTLRDHMIWYRM